MFWANTLVSANVLAEGNSIHADMGRSWALVDLFAVGLTVQVQGNRLTETVAHTTFSAAAGGSIIGALAHNVGTHCFLEYDGGNITAGHGNRSVVDPGGKTCKALLSDLRRNYKGDKNTGRTKEWAAKLEIDHAKKKHEARPIGGVGPKASSGDHDDVLADYRVAHNEARILAATEGAKASFRLERRAAMLERLAARERDPVRAARHLGHAAASSRIATKLGNEVLRTTAKLRALPAEPDKGASLYGRVVDALEVPQAHTTVALLDATGAVVAWTATNRAGWYGFSTAKVGEGMSLQVSDVEGTVLSTVELGEVADGAEVLEMLTLPLRPTGAAPPPGVERAVPRHEDVLVRIASVRSRSDEIAAARDGLRARHAKATETRKAADDERHAVVVELEKVEEARKQCKQDLAELTARIRELGPHASEAQLRERKQLEAELVRLEVKARRLEDRQDQLASVVASADADLEALEATLVEHEAELVELATTIETLEAQRSTKG
jgi:hypothetical protein